MVKAGIKIIQINIIFTNINYKHMKSITKMLIVVFFLSGTHTLFAQKKLKCMSIEHFLDEISEANWSANLLYDKKNKFYYQFANNEEKLYVHLVVTDETVQKKILTFGFTTRIDTTGKKKEKLGVHFPLQDKNKRPPKRSHDGEDDFYIKKYELTQKLTLAKLTGFEGKRSERTINIHEEGRVDLDMKFNKQGHLLYKLTIPMKMISASFNTANNPVLSVCFETGYLKSSEMPQPPGGGNRQGPPRGKNNMQEMMSPSKLWIRNIHLNLLSD